MRIQELIDQLELCDEPEDNGESYRKNNEGVKLVKQGEIKLSMDMFNKAIELNKYFHIALSNRAVTAQIMSVLDLCKSLSLAIKELENCEDSESSRVGTIFNLIDNNVDNIVSWSLTKNLANICKI